MLTHVSETYALNLHIPNPHCHGYCCQNTLSSKGKPENQSKNSYSYTCYNHFHSEMNSCFSLIDTFHL